MASKKPGRPIEHSSKWSQWEILRYNVNRIVRKQLQHIDPELNNPADIKQLVSHYIQQAQEKAKNYQGNIKDLQQQVLLKVHRYTGKLTGIPVPEPDEFTQNTLNKDTSNQAETPKPSSNIETNAFQTEHNGSLGTLQMTPKTAFDDFNSPHQDASFGSPLGGDLIANDFVTPIEGAQSFDMPQEFTNTPNTGLNNTAFDTGLNAPTDNFNTGINSGFNVGDSFDNQSFNTQDFNTQSPPISEPISPVDPTNTFFNNPETPLQDTSPKVINPESPAPQPMSTEKAPLQHEASVKPSKPKTSTKPLKPSESAPIQHPTNTKALTSTETPSTAQSNIPEITEKQPTSGFTMGSESVEDVKALRQQQSRPKKKQDRPDWGEQKQPDQPDQIKKPNPIRQNNTSGSQANTPKKQPVDKSSWSLWH